MQTAKEFFDFFNQIPDNQWTTGELWNREGKCCALGHLGLRGYMEINNSELIIPCKTDDAESCKELLNNVCTLGKIFGKNDPLEAQAIIFNINDNSSVYQGPGPKYRILNELSKYL